MFKNDVIKTVKYVFFWKKERYVIAESNNLSEDFIVEVWTPKYPILSLRLAYILKNFFFFIMFLIFDFFYEIWLVKNKSGEIIHQSTVHGRYFKFPFMKSNDLQIGLVETKKEYRNRGLASMVVNKILQKYLNGINTIWYITQQGNLESKKVAKKVDFCGPIMGHKEIIKIPIIKYLSKYFLD